MKKIYIITLKIAILLIITGGLLKLIGLNLIDMIRDPFIFFSEETARSLDTVNEPYIEWNEEEFQKQLEEDFILGENGYYYPK